MDSQNESYYELFDSHYGSPLKTNLFVFTDIYSNIHGWLSVLVCGLGIVFNLFNIICLRKSKLASDSVKKILISIAFCDMVIMAVYMPFCIYFYIFHHNQMFTQHTFVANIYSNVSLLVCITFHSVSIWLTVYLSVYRYLFMDESVASIRSRNNSQFKYKKSKLVKFILMNSTQTILIICLFSILFCLPTFFYSFYSVAKNEAILIKNFSFEQNSSTQNENVDKKKNILLLKINFYLQALLGKILPCICLTVFTILIIKQLATIRNNKAKLNAIIHFSSSIKTHTTRIQLKRGRIYRNKTNRRNSLNCDHNTDIQTENINCLAGTVEANSQSNVNRENDHLSKTVMLLLVCVLLLIAELPHSILLLISIFYEKVYMNVYKPLGDLLDMFVLFTYLVNFLVYCFMSESFRNEFYSFLKTSKNCRNFA